MANWRRSSPDRSMSMMTQLAMSPASSRAQRCTVTASLNVLLSRSSPVTAVTMSIRRVMAAAMSSEGTTLPRPRPLWGGAFPAPRLPTPARGAGHHEQARAVLQGDDVRGQGGGRPGRPGRAAGTPPAGPSRPRGRGQLALDRGAGRQIHERRQRLTGRVPGRRADQVPGPAVRAPHRGPPHRARTRARARAANTARSRARSALSESAEPGGAVSAAASASLASTSTAASSSAQAASRSTRASAPGLVAARRSASRRPARSAESVYEPFGQVSCDISPRPSSLVKRL